MMPSIEAQALIRRKAEEQSAVLSDFSAWEATIKQNDAKIQKKKRLEIKPMKLSNDDDSARQRGGHKSTVEIESETSSTPTFLGRSNSIVIGRGQHEAEPKAVVAKAPHRKEVNGIKKTTKVKEESEEEEREKGNSLFSDGDYRGAIKKYDHCIELNPSSALAYSNRAMAHLKLKDWQSAESDASSAINIDKFHIKSYQRRSAARLALGKIRASLKDLHSAKVALKISAETNSTDMNKKKILPSNIKVSHVESELKKIMINAPKRKVHIQVNKSSSSKLDKDSNMNLKNNSTPCPVSSSVRNISLKNIKSWLEFEQIWKSGLQSHEKIKCLETMRPHKFIELYKNGMEDSDLLLDIIFHCSKIKETGASYILALTEIPSIDMVVMMLSKAEKRQLSDYIEEAMKLCPKQVDSHLIKTKFGVE